MSSPNDKDFPDDNSLDDIFTSHDDPMNETGIQDAVEEGGIDDISDYDDSEDGIFAPAPQKKKSASSALLGTVAVVALLGAGGFYVYKHPDLLASFTGGTEPIVIPTAALPQETAPVDVPATTTADASTPLESAPAPQDPALEAIPQPQAITNTGDTAVEQGDSQTLAAEQSAAPVEAVAAVPDTSAAEGSATSAPVATSEQPAAPVATEVPSEAAAMTPSQEAPASPITPAPQAAMPAPPTPEETKVAIADAAPVKTDVQPEAKAPEVVKTPVPAPEEKALVAAPKEVAKKKTADPVVEKPKAEAKPVAETPKKSSDTVYFDAPKGKALTDIPLPSMNTKRGNNESIMIVGKQSSFKEGDASISSTSQESGVAAATRALRLARYDAALDMFNDLYAANPRDTRILMGRAIALQKLRRSDESIKAYEAALAVNPDNSEAIVNLMGLVRKEYPAQALEKLLTLKARNPGNAGIIAQLGIAYADSGNLEDAASNLLTASRIEPKNPQHYFNLGVVAERMKNRTRAIAYYEKALEVDAVYGTGRAINRDMIYDRLTRLRG